MGASLEVAMRVSLGAGAVEKLSVGLGWVPVSMGACLHQGTLSKAWSQ